MLIHGRFTFGDRSRLERRLTDTENKLPMILVATQIVEVSLDIDYDVMYTEACYPDSLVHRAGRFNRRGKLGNNGEGLIRVFLPEEWFENKDKSSLPYDNELFSASIAMIRDRALQITSEYDYVTITNDFYNENWTSSSREAQERYEQIWEELSYIYKADLSEERMVELLRTRSGIVNVTAYSRTHWERIVDFEYRISSISPNNVDERHSLYLQLRMYSISVPISRSIKLTQRSVTTDDDRSNPRQYLIAQADYDPSLGLLVDI
jgi:CRISPR-associated endonuclease/helicase Cas3